MTSERPIRGRLILAFATVYVVWGSTYLAIRFGVETIPPFILAGSRFLIAGAVLFAWSLANGAGLPSRRHWREAFVIGAPMLLGGNGLVTWAEQTVPSGVAALIVASVPLFVVILQGKRPSVATLSGILLGFAGIAILVGPGALDDGERVDPWGALALVLASASWAAGSLYTRRADRPRSGLQAAGMQMLGGGVLLAFASLASGRAAAFEPGTVSARSALSLAYLVVFGSIAGFTAYTWLLRNTSPDRAATYAYVNPVVAVLLGWALAGEPLTWRVAAAGAVIVAAVALIVRASTPPPPTAARGRREVERS